MMVNNPINGFSKQTNKQTSIVKMYALHMGKIKQEYLIISLPCNVTQDTLAYE